VRLYRSTTRGERTEAACASWMKRALASVSRVGSARHASVGSGSRSEHPTREPRPAAIHALKRRTRRAGYNGVHFSSTLLLVSVYGPAVRRSSVHRLHGAPRRLLDGHRIVFLPSNLHSTAISVMSAVFHGAYVDGHPVSARGQGYFRHIHLSVWT
jgi:hypothetical protein